MIKEIIYALTVTIIQIILAIGVCALLVIKDDLPMFLALLCLFEVNLMSYHARQAQKQITPKNQ